MSIPEDTNERALHKIGDIVLVPCVVLAKGIMVYTLEQILDVEVISRPGTTFSIYAADVNTVI